MKVRILSSAFNDLASGRAFYDDQGAGLGDYFYDSVFSDIDSLALYGGIPLQDYGMPSNAHSPISVRCVL